MERLTARNQYGGAYYPYCFKSSTCDGTGCSEKCATCEFSEKLAEKLAAYEDTCFTPEQVVEMAKELAELKKQLLPCKAGDTVYWVNNHYRTHGDYKVDEEKVELLIFDGEDWIANMGEPKDGIFGKTVFLTKEEAEAKLKKWRVSRWMKI